MTKNHFSITNTICAICILFLLSSCTFTSTNIKNPEFKIKLDSLSSELNMLAPSENINIIGIESKTNGNSTNIIEIEIKNAKNFPSEENGQIELSKKMASLVKKSLKDTNSFSKYSVKFIEQTTGIVTKKSWRTFSYKVSDI